MLQTFVNNQFSSVVSGSTITVLPGTAKVGNTLAPFDGTSMQVGQISGLSGHPNQYQNALLYLEMPDATATGIDMTSALSATSSSIAGLVIPQMANSNGFPVGLYTFFSADGTSSQLISYKGI